MIERRLAKTASPTDAPYAGNHATISGVMATSDRKK
jgi:hypothetical protein